MQLTADRFRTLVVDDSPLARERICSFLASDPKVEVVGTAGDGKEALTCMERLHPDLVLLDLQMPGLNGLEVATLITRDEGRPVVVIITGLEVPALVQRLKEYGISGLVSKQHLNDELPEVLDRVLPKLRH
jgi:DNA-binding NarL/FixJ family response regulator